MRTLEYGATQHVPAFLTKLWKLVTDTSCDDLISWSVAGTSFIIYDEIRFSKELLPLYFKHNNMASFVRQLNMYGFRKLSCIDQGGMHSYKNEIEFYHQYFLKDQASLLEQIKRKIPISKTEEPKVRQEYINELITNIKSLRGKQDSAEQGMRSLRRENKMLWRHVQALADRSTKQQAVLQQLVPFFMNMVRTNRSVPQLKRKAPLMIDEGEIASKIPCATPTSSYFVEHEDHSQSSELPSTAGNISNRGPVIHDVTELEGSKMFADSILCSTAKENEVIVDSPLSSSVESSDQATGSPSYADPAHLKTFDILNSSYESQESLSPQMTISCSPLSVPSPLLQQFSPSSPVMPMMNMPMVVPQLPIHDETTSDVSMLQEAIMRNQFVPKVEAQCSDSSGYYSLPCGVNDGASSSSQSTSVMPSSYPQQAKPSDSDMSWLLNQGYSTDPNIENWLGQIFKTDNLIAGCSLPQVETQNIPLI